MREQCELVTHSIVKKSIKDLNQNDLTECVAQFHHIQGGKNTMLTYFPETFDCVEITIEFL